jgi:peroxiredoxin
METERLFLTKILKMNNMCVRLLIIFLLFSSALLGQNRFQKEIPAGYGYIVKIGQKLPEFEMKLTDGRTISTSDLKGKVVMLQFTASWCGVCRKEMPHIEKEIWKKNKNHPDFVLYGIDMDEPLEKVIKFGKDVGITYPLALDPGAKIFYTFAEKNAGVTRNVIIDKSGTIIFMTRLYKVEEFNRMKKVINKLINE